MEEITVLGEKYSIEVVPEEDDRCLETSNGYCDFSTRSIIIRDMMNAEDDPNSLRDMKMFVNKVKSMKLYMPSFVSQGCNVKLIGQLMKKWWIG